MNNDKMLWCQEDYTHVSNMGKDNEKSSGLGGGNPYETFTSSVGELYRSCVKQHGRCIGRMYVDDKFGKRTQCGWIFLKKNPPEPAGDGEGVIQTWVTVWVKPPQKKVIWTQGTYPSFKRVR